MKVRYAILDSENVVVSEGKTFESNSVDWGKIRPRYRIEEAYEKPYVLILYYEPEKGKKSPRDAETFDCPKIEIHFVVERIMTHMNEILCDDFELD